MIDLNEINKNEPIRVFVSSTFRDMQVEREHLIKSVFPTIRQMCREREVDFMEIDLRWGITEEQEKQGKVVEVCLDAIDHCRPYFIGILGERYGSLPNGKEYLTQGKPAMEYPWLKKDLENGLSITEIEIQHGVLRQYGEEPIAFFYFRKPGATQVEFREQENSVPFGKLKRLKAEIIVKKYPLQYYSTTKELDSAVIRDFTSYLKDNYQKPQLLSPLVKLQHEHAAFARNLLKVYIKDEQCLAELDKHVAGNDKPLVITGEQGCGKSALLANWIKHYQAKHKGVWILYHFVGGATESSDIYALMSRIMREMKERFHLKGEIPEEPDKIAVEFSRWLEKTPANIRWVLVIDALNQLEDKDNAKWLGWLPTSLPSNLRVILTTSFGKELDACRERNYPELEVATLTLEQKLQIIPDYLDLYGKKLSPPVVGQIAGYKLTNNVLMLRTLLDELRIFGFYEKLHTEIHAYLELSSTSDFFGKILTRFEHDYESDSPGLVGKVLSLLWASRYGLTEDEIKEICGISTLIWQPLYYGLENHLINRNGVLCFASHYLYQAVEERYMNTDAAKSAAHSMLLLHFKEKEITPRTFAEVPYHLKFLKQWEGLKDYLVNCSLFKAINMEKNYLVLLDYWRCLSNRWDMEQEYKQSNKACKDSLRPVPTGLNFFSSDFSEIKEEQLTYGIISMQMAKLLIWASRHNLAVSLLQDSCNIFNTFVSKTDNLDQIVYTARSLIVFIYMKQRLLYKAEPVLVRMIEDLAQNTGKHSTTMAELKTTLGSLYTTIKQYDKAELLLTEALDIAQECEGEPSQATATCYNNLSVYYSAIGQPVRAMEHLQKALDLRTRLFGRQHPETIILISTQAIYLMNCGQIDKAMELAREAIDSCTLVIGYDDPETARAYKTLAMCYLKAGYYARAENNILTALEIIKRTLGADDINFGECLQWLAISVGRQERFADAYQYFSRALEIFTSTYGTEHPNTIFITEQMAFIKTRL